MNMKRVLIGVLFLVGLFLLSGLALSQESDGAVVTLKWSEPQARENGEALEPEEIDGYEIRYYENSGDDFEVILLGRDGSPTTEHSFSVPPGQHLFKIAAFDTDGLYSNFIELSGDAGGSPPESVLEFRLEFNIESVDRFEECANRVNCTVF